MLFVIPFASSLPKIKLLHAFNRTVDGLHDAQFELGLLFCIYLLEKESLIEFIERLINYDMSIYFTKYRLQSINCAIVN